MKKHPFTLIEILAALVVLSILAGMGLGIASYASERGKEMRTQSTLKLIEAALEQYKRKFGDYPVLPTATVGAAVGNPIFALPLFNETPSSDNRNINKNLLGCFSGVTISNDRVTGIAGMGDILKYGNYDVLADGWGQPIIYLYPGYRNRGKYDLGSFGPDTKIGDGGTVKFTVDKDSYEIATPLPSFGNRNGSPYSSFGEGDDIVNFKR